MKTQFRSPRREEAHSKEMLHARPHPAQLPRGEDRGENSPQPVLRFEPLNQPAHSNVKTRGAFPPLRVGGVGGADGERAGVRCAFSHLEVHGQGGRFH